MGVALDSTKRQSALQRWVGDFFMAQVAAITILIWKQRRIQQVPPVQKE